MRSRERLIDVLCSINRNAVGQPCAAMMAVTADAIAGKHVITGNGMRAVLDRYSSVHPSPHIRELATEALHYLKQDMEAANG